MIYTGFGPKDTPFTKLQFLLESARKLVKKDTTLRLNTDFGVHRSLESGNFDGIFEYLEPSDISESVEKLILKIHPDKKYYLSTSMKKKTLHQMALMLLLGKSLKKPVDFVIYWNENNDKDVNIMVELAEMFRIKTYDISDYEDIGKFISEQLRIK